MLRRRPHRIRACALVVLAASTLAPGLAARRQVGGTPAEGAAAADVPQSTRPPSPRRIATDLAKSYLTRYPWLASERGAPSMGPVLGRFGNDVRDEWITTIDTARSALAANDREALDESARADFDALARFLDAERTRFEARSIERWCAPLYVERVDRSLRVLLASSPVAPGEWSDARAILVALPRFWTNTRRSLVAPMEDWNGEALRALENLTLLLQAGRATVVAAASSDEERDETDALFDAALRATREFGDWLSAPIDTAGGSTVRMGERYWLRLVQNVSGTTWDAGRLRWELLRRIADAERAYGARWRDERRMIETDPARVASFGDVLRRASAGALAHTTSLAITPAEASERPFDFRASDAPARYGLEALSLATPKGACSILVESAVIPFADDAATEALAIRYGYPGEALLRGSAAASNDWQRRVLWNRSLVEGWGLFALQLVLETRDDVPEVLLAEAARLRVVEAARLVLALELHALDYSVAEAADGFRHRTGTDVYRAMSEARRAEIDPLRGIGFLGFVELDRAFDALAIELDTKRAAARITASAMENPHLRAKDLLAR